MTELVAAYRQGVPVEELAAAFQVHRTTVIGHVRRHGVPKRERRALRGEDVGRAIQLYAEGRSADWVAAQFGVAASTVRRALKEAGIALRPGGGGGRTRSETADPAAHEKTRAGSGRSPRRTPAAHEPGS